jgi:hypothetical protein
VSTTATPDSFTTLPDEHTLAIAHPSSSGAAVNGRSGGAS